MSLQRWLQGTKVELAEWAGLAVWRPLATRLASARDARLEPLRGKRKLLLTLGPSHGNLGDHAIAYATRAYLADHFGDFVAIEVSIKDLPRRLRALQGVMEPGDLVVLLGGGNTGDLYRNEEWTRQLVIRSFPGLPVVSLPQTAHFTDTGRGRRELQRARQVYGSHQRLLYMARDPATLAFMQREFPGLRTFLQPDMVQYLDEREPARTRSGVTVCLRRDKETVLQGGLRKEILVALQGAMGRLDEFDTIAPHGVDQETRAAELEAVWSQLRRAEVAVTDRLHGMLFCFITGTPCVAIRSFDRKVIEAFHQLKDKQDFISLVEDPTPTGVVEAVRLAAAGGPPWRADLRSAYFDDLRGRILESLGSAAPAAARPGKG